MRQTTDEQICRNGRNETSGLAILLDAVQYMQLRMSISGAEREKERERKNFIGQVTPQITVSTTIINYNGRLPEKANAHQRWPPLTQ